MCALESRTVQRAHDDDDDNHERNDSQSPIVLSLFERHPYRLLDVAQAKEILDEVHAGCVPGWFFALHAHQRRFGLFDEHHAVDEREHVQYRGYGVHAVEAEFAEQHAGQRGTDGHADRTENVHDTDSQRAHFHLENHGGRKRLN